MSNYRYEIDENNAIRIFEGDSEVPFIFQPDWPAVVPWESKEQAEDWAQVFISALEDPLYPYEAGDRPENHPIARIIEEPETEEDIITS